MDAHIKLRHIPGPNSEATLNAMGRAHRERALALAQASELDGIANELEQTHFCQLLSEIMATPEAKEASLLCVSRAVWLGRFKIIPSGETNLGHWFGLAKRLDALSPSLIEKFQNGQHNREIRIGHRDSSPARIAHRLGWGSVGAQLEAAELATAADAHGKERAAGPKLKSL